MSEVALALLWHQHQPYYPDDLTGENPMPWVRLHGTKDYYGMALHLLEVPEMRCTINLVPSLLAQILAYAEKGATDRFLQVSQVHAADLHQNDALFLLDHFFMANPDQMIRPWARFWELYQRRAQGKHTAKDCLRRFHERDLRDLQVLYNLAWIHPLAFEQDGDLQLLRDKGRHYSEEDKNQVLDKQREILRRILPLHKKLVENGQVELTTTPFYHPILPLLFDKKLAREAMPHVKLPHYTGGYPEDAAVQVRRAMLQHEELFGVMPRGMWPAEGSVCQAMIPLLAQQGIRWIATDEGILGHSTHGAVSRDAHGHVRNPGLLYRPYKVREGDHELDVVFRDHALSDLIGFHYQRSNGADAAHDFMKHLHDTRQAIAEDEPALVSVILDGENCWEHYPEGGVPFLRSLYQALARDKTVRPVKIGEYLTSHPPTDTLPHLFAGSWIHHDFAIWIGHSEDNAGWDVLHKTREYLRQRAEQPEVDPDKLRRAWEEMYIAEGSDWFWWYGDDHSCAQDALFDSLFRKHLQNVYHLLGDTPPAELSRAISRSGQKQIHTLPRSFLDVKIDGLESFFEWSNAGRHTCQSERGTMAMTTRGPLREVYFGFNLKNFLARIDFDQPAKAALQSYEILRIGFEEPRGQELRILHPGKPTQSWTWLVEGEPAEAAGKIEVGIDRIAEVAIAFDLLGAEIKEPLHFCVELLENQQSRDRAPREGNIQFARPSPEFEQVMWDV